MHRLVFVCIVNKNIRESRNTVFTAYVFGHMRRKGNE